MKITIYHPYHSTVEIVLMGHGHWEECDDCGQRTQYMVDVVEHDTEPCYDGTRWTEDSFCHELCLKCEGMQHWLKRIGFPVEVVE